ncbi:MAG: Na+/H+ antiporter NhaC family protein [Bacillaceae bacterium]
MSNTIFCLLPPLVIIGMVIMTRRVVLSLGVGVIVGSLVVTSFQPMETIKKIGEVIRNLFLDGESLNTGNLYILAFLLLLGLLTGFINVLGGNEAFGRLAKKKIKSKRGATVTTAAMGMTLFPDDVFNMFSVGQIARPIVDAHRLSRQKLAYLLHTTSDPLCVLCPISSWGAYIISILAMIFTTNALDHNALISFVKIAPMNFYAITSIILVFTVAYFHINIGKMKEAEATVQTKKAIDTENAHPYSSVWDLLLPIVTLIVVALVSIVMTGYNNSDSNTVTLLNIFENAEVSLSLILGSFTALVITLILYGRNVYIRKNTAISTFKIAINDGLRTTLPAIIILLFAWMVSDLTKQLETGYYLADFVNNISLPFMLLPFTMFLLTGFMAFSTGTSWGTFAIMLPIAAQISIATDEAEMFSMMAAVLAGSLFGDHSSPISDTTTVAAAAAGCNQFDHFQTQLPYTLTAASITAISFLIFGFTDSYLLTYGFIALCICGFIFYWKKQTILAKQTKKVA